MRKCKQKRKQENAKTRNTKRENPKTRKAQKTRKGETRKRESPKTRKLKRKFIVNMETLRAGVSYQYFYTWLSLPKKKKIKSGTLTERVVSVHDMCTNVCVYLNLHIYTYTCCCLAMNMPCISCWISWIGRIPRTEVAAAATLLPGARDISKAKSLLFKVLGCLHSVSTRKRDALQGKLWKIWWNSVGWQVDMWALISLLISKSWKSVLISFGVGFACRCTPVLFSWPSDTDPLVQAFGGSC